MTAVDGCCWTQVNTRRPGRVDRVLSAASGRRCWRSPRASSSSLAAGRPGGASPLSVSWRTLNPALDPGRQVLSPAFRSRFVGRLHVPAVGEAGFRAMLRFNVLGEAPLVEYGGQQYRGIDPPLVARPAYAELASLPHVEELLDRLALLFTKLGVLLAGRGTGRAAGPLREDPVAFTRRDLLAMLDRLLARRRRLGARADLALLLIDVLEDTFLHGLARAEDRDAVADLLVALGLHRSRWVALGSTGTARRDSRRPSLEPARCWQTIDGELSEPGAEAAYRLALRQGEGVELSTSPHAGGAAADFDTFLRLLDPDGAEVAADDDSGEGLTSWLRHTVAADGVHEVRVAASLPTQVGGFRLAWRAPSQPLLQPAKLLAEPGLTRSVLVSDSEPSRFDLDTTATGLVVLTCDGDQPGYAESGAHIRVIDMDDAESDEDGDPFEEDELPGGAPGQTAVFVVAGHPHPIEVYPLGASTTVVRYRVEAFGSPRALALRQWELLEAELTSERPLCVLPLQLSAGPWCLRSASTAAMPRRATAWSSCSLTHVVS